MNNTIRTVFKILADATQRKHLFRWVMSLQDDYLMKTRQPWLTFDAMDYLNTLSLNGLRIFEYGSGGSTLFWSEKGASCVSIEHDTAWYTKVRALLLHYPQIDYRCVAPVNTSNEAIADPADPDSYISSLSMYQSFSFLEYVSQIDAFPDNYFDVVLIDGRARPSCIKHSANKVSINGILILDNSDREYYLKETEAYLINFSKLGFYGVGPTSDTFWKTDVYLRHK
jgi:hypothetical protein